MLMNAMKAKSNLRIVHCGDREKNMYANFKKIKKE